MKKYFVADLREGTKIEDVFLITSKSVGSTRAGSPFIKFKLSDRSGSLDAVKWDATEVELGGVQEFDYALVHGAVRQYNGDLQVTIDSFHKYADSVNPADFLPSTTNDPDQMYAELQDILKGIQNQHLKKLLSAFFDNTDTASRFRKAPAATKNHHAYIGGLLEHTLSVVKLCETFCLQYPELDRDLLLTAAALHDIGKVEEFEWSVAIRYSDAGHLVGHVVGGAMLVKEAASKIEGLDPLLNLALQHAILAHHGNYEWGSPKLPKSLEALVLHAADDLDAKLEMYKLAIEDSDRNGENGLFTKRHFLLNRYIFKGIPNSGNGKTEEQPTESSFDSDLFAAEDYDPFAKD